jgi:glycosyltransferase involved in cell wall biosynthesis
MDGTRVKRGPWKTWVRNAVLRRWYSRVAAGLAIARYMERHYLEHGIPSERIFWTPYCVDNRRFRERANELPAKAELKGRLGLEGCELVVLFCGKLQPKKDPLLLTAAIRAMANRARAGLLVVGDGELRREMEKAAENCGARKVVFAGFKNQTELPACYAASDVLVLPSPYGETWGLVVNEGMNFGLPAIVSDHVGCAHDLVRHEETGYVFRASDPIALAGFLDHLASHPDVLAKLGASARQRVASYSIEACVQGMKQALQAVCASGGRGAPGK